MVRFSGGGGRSQPTTPKDIDALHVLAVLLLIFFLIAMICLSLFYAQPLVARYDIGSTILIAGGLLLLLVPFVFAGRILQELARLSCTETICSAKPATLLPLALAFIG